MLEYRDAIAGVHEDTLPQEPTTATCHNLRQARMAVVRPGPQVVGPDRHAIIQHVHPRDRDLAVELIEQILEQPRVDAVDFVVKHAGVIDPGNVILHVIARLAV